MKRKLIPLLLILTMMLPAYYVLAADPVQLLAVVKSSVKVRAEPSTAARQLGLLKAGGKLYVTGRDEAADWLHFRYWGTPAWVRSTYLQVEGDIQRLPVVSGDAIEVDGGISLVGYEVVPAVPAPGSEVQLRLKLKSAAPVGAFQIAGDVAGQFVMQRVDHLEAGEQGVSLTLVAPGSTGVHSGKLALDVDRQVSAGAVAGVRFFVDYPRVVQSSVRIPPYTNIDLYGGTPDLAFDGAILTAVNGAALMPLVDVALSDVHYDLLGQVKDTTVQPQAGQLLALRTAEGGRGCLRVVRWSEDAIAVEFFLYA